MSEISQIQLGSKKFVNSTNKDGHTYVELKNSNMEILPYDESSVINAAQLFDDERQASQVYRFYGTINFMSLINGLQKDYTSVNDFFIRPSLGDEASGLTRNILSCFDIYLCRPLGNTFLVTGNTLNGTTFGGSVNTRPYVTLTGVTQTVNGNIIVGGTGATYQLQYQVLTNPATIQLYKSGYQKNIYYDQTYSFNFNVDIDVDGQTDSFGKPLTQLYLFVNFKPSTNGNGIAESVTQNTYNSSTRSSRPYVLYSGGSVVDGDWCFYDMTNFEESLIEQREYYISMPCSGGTGTSLSFNYNPFIPIKLRDFGGEIISGNITGTSETDQQIPDYAVNIDANGNYLWEDILQNGYIDPISNRGVNYSFINKRHYVFSNIVLPVTTDLNNSATAHLFQTIRFGANTKQYTKPTSDLNNLGNKC